MVTLVVAGFMIVALPLLVAVVGGALFVDRLTARGEQLVRDSVALAREGQDLGVQLAQMERNARQYRIVGQPGLLQLYQERHEALLATLDALDRQALGLGARAERERLRMVARDVAAALVEASPESERTAAALERFGLMRELAADVREAADRAIRDELAQLEARSAQAREFLYWQVVALVPVTLLLVGVFSWLILRPIGRLARAIRSLGAREPPEPIAVGGPPEIRALGEELERLRGRLERSEAEKNRFLRHMSHELKTPLAAIREGTELIADGSVSADSKAHAEILDILRGSSMELQQLIENLLVLSARNLAQAPEEIRVPQLVKEALTRHRLALARQKVRIDHDVENTRFSGFRPLVQSALSNLVGNAIRFSPQGGQLHVRGRRRGARVILEVADDGPGIPEAERAHVFEPFYQGASRPQAAVRGTGVGLSVVRDCARAHDGEVEIVDGEFPGAHIRLVLQDQHAPRPGAVS
jgi:two-component system sensor histidine kinase GlrK